MDYGGGGDSRQRRVLISSVSMESPLCRLVQVGDIVEEIEDTPVHEWTPTELDQLSTTRSGTERTNPDPAAAANPSAVPTLRTLDSSTGTSTSTTARGKENSCIRSSPFLSNAATSSITGAESCKRPLPTPPPPLIATRSRNRPKAKAWAAGKLNFRHYDLKALNLLLHKLSTAERNAVFRYVVEGRLRFALPEGFNTYFAKNADFDRSEFDDDRCRVS